MILSAILVALVQAAVCLDGCTLTENLVVCTDREHIERLNDLRSDGDTEAFQEYSMAALMMFLTTGEGCTMWESGTDIYADWEGTFIPSDVAEVRKRGSSTRWWALQNTIKGRG